MFSKIKILIEPANDCNGSDSASEELIAKNEAKKRKKHGRMREVMKKVRLQSHELGENCNCQKSVFKMCPQKQGKVY